MCFEFQFCKAIEKLKDRGQLVKYLYEVNYMAKTVQNYIESGVEISKSTIYVGDEVTLSYSGILVKDGADMVYAYLGYGDDWEEKGFVPLRNVDGVFKADFKVILPGTMNVSFKDSANNWDNNSTANYVFKVTPKAAKPVKKVSATELESSEACEVKAEEEKKCTVEAPKKRGGARSKK